MHQMHQIKQPTEYCIVQLNPWTNFLEEEKPYYLVTISAKLQLAQKSCSYALLLYMLQIAEAKAAAGWGFDIEP